MKSAWALWGGCFVASAMLTACSSNESDSSADVGVPSGGAASPVGGESAPVGGTPAPVGGTPAPVGGTPAPVGGTPAPVGGTPAPVGGEPAPIGGEPAPVGGEPAPVGGEPAPVGGEPAPVGGAPSPAGPTQEQVAAILIAACNGCHIGGTSGGLSLAGDFTQATVNVPSGQSDLDLIEPGDRAASYLYRKVEGTHIEAGGRSSRMPLGAALTAEEVETIGLWIDSL